MAQTRIFTIEALELEFPNGVRTQYERIGGSSNDTVIIVPILDDGHVLLIREYAAGTHRYELSLPKGLMEKDETPLEAANRELMEEIGYASNSLSYVTALTLAPGYLSARTHIILAQTLYESRREGDEPQDIEVIPWRLDRFEALLDRDDFSEARSIAALFIVRARLANDRGKRQQ